MWQATLPILCLASTSALRVRTPVIPGFRGTGRLFLDTADSAEWEALLPLGIWHGVTTNPTLLEAAGVECTIESCRGLARRAFELSAGEVMMQTWGSTVDEMVHTGLQLSAVDPANVVVKVPVTECGTTAAAKLVNQGVRVCLTACYARHQAIVAAGVGAEYLAPYLGRMTDAGKDGLQECLQMQDIVDGMGSGTRILVASLRDVDLLSSLTEKGIGTLTFSPAVARQLFDVPLTTAAATAFEEAAKRGGSGVQTAALTVSERAALTVYTRPRGGMKGQWIPTRP